MKVLLINGSPHAHGCTFTALSVVADELQKGGMETEIVHVGHKDIRGCIGCYKCKDMDDKQQIKARICLDNTNIPHCGQVTRTSDSSTAWTSQYV